MNRYFYNTASENMMTKMPSGQRIVFSGGYFTSVEDETAKFVENLEEFKQGRIYETTVEQYRYCYNKGLRPKPIEKPAVKPEPVAKIEETVAEEKAHRGGRKPKE